MDVDDVLVTLQEIGSKPTVPYHEGRVLRAIASELERYGLPTAHDEYGQVSTHIARGEAKRSLVFVAHTDHPGFEVISASGREGRVRILGGLRPGCFKDPVPVLVYDDDGGGGDRATLDDFIPRIEPEHNVLGTCRLRAGRDISRGDWAVLDLPGLERSGDELRMRAADDLAGCALAVSALAQLRDRSGAFDVRALFTRAEETGLFGARIAAEDGTLPRDAIVVSIEASNAVFAPAGGGVVVRAGDYHNTFSNEAERYLRVAQERLADREPAVPTQRKLLAGGTCEASAFVRMGWAATGIALPNVSYHNNGEDRFVAETIRLSDVLSGIALLTEAALAAGEDASESWWPRVGPVPDEIRALLRSTRLPGRTQE